MRFSTAITLALTSLLVASALGAVAAAPSPEPVPTDGSSHRASPLEPAPQVQFAADDPAVPAEADPAQVVRIDVDDDGDARWTVESRFLITDEEEEDAFDEHAELVTSGARDVGYDASQFQQFVTAANESTGREMTIEDPGWDEPRTVSPEEIDEADDGDSPENATIGVISYSFTWTNFATVDGDRIRVGDVFADDDGSWFNVDYGQRLIVQPPSGYGFHEFPSSTSSNEGALIWDGPHEFDRGEFEITFHRAGSGGGGPGGSSGFPWWMGGAIAVVFAVGYVLAKRDVLTWPDDRPSLPDAVRRSIDDALDSVRNAKPTRDETEFVETDGAGSTAASSDGDPSEANADPDGAVRPASAGQVADAASETELEYDEDDSIDVELLSDEERVLRLLRQNGGRMKQASIVKETGWSNAKVSQLLSKMDDDDEIEKLRIGRENLITLPEVDPTEVD
ncbi:helix-turn-helix transcriptional regulator [Natrialbaceae archaeon GCM10025810]|uniref:helix-turn-helix transcriptional regulator n=1 Tax=Halovalidus salilacus TaxID=3075124 RepID=UPI00360B277C